MLKIDRLTKQLDSVAIYYKGSWTVGILREIQQQKIQLLAGFSVNICD